MQSPAYVIPKKIGVIGFCMGGGLALHATAGNSDVGAVAAFYGGGSPPAEVFANSRAAILNICGEQDTRVTTTIRALDDGLKRYALPHELVIYPNAGHAFFNDTRTQVYDPDAARDAWKRAVDWFRKYLTA